MDTRSILVELLRKLLCIGYSHYHSLFFVCGFKGSYALASKLEVIGHKHLILRLTDHDIYRRMLSINLLEELQRLFCYRQHVSIFEALKGGSVWYWSLSRNHTGIMKEFFQITSVGFTLCKVEQPLQGIVLQEKEAQKDWNIQEISLERTYS